MIRKLYVQQKKKKQEKTNVHMCMYDETERQRESSPFYSKKKRKSAMSIKIPSP